MKTFPKMGRGQGPGGKFAGFLFLIKSISSSRTQIKNKHPLKSKQSNKEYNIMVVLEAGSSEVTQLVSDRVDKAKECKKGKLQWASETSRKTN